MMNQILAERFVLPPVLLGYMMVLIADWTNVYVPGHHLQKIGISIQYVEPTYRLSLHPISWIELS